MFPSTRWYARELERRERAWAAERDQLINTICRLAGKPHPADTPPRPEPVERTWTPTPDQLP